MPSFLEFFAGGGMARAGLGTGWECLLANDIDPKKAEAYRANWGGGDLVVCDIAEISAAQIGRQADLAWASFPCQDLSLAGHYEGLDGERSGTFWAFLKIVCDLGRRGRKPRIVMLENVYGALTSHQGADFDAIAKGLGGAGYVFGAVVIDAVHFVPQSRPRVFVLAVEKAAEIPSSAVQDGPDPAWHPSAVIKAYHRLTSDMKSDWMWWKLPVPQTPVQALDDIIDPNPSGVEWDSPQKTQTLLEMMTPLNRRKVLAAQSVRGLHVGTVYKRTRLGVQRAEVRFDGISGCLRTPTGGSSRQIIMEVKGAKVRTRLLAPREAARLMGLPETYALPNSYNDAYHVCGDGVVVPVVAHLRAHLLDPIVAANQVQRRSRAA